MEKISVIIPVYNAEPYIQRCFQSLFDQTYQNWEAIVINDGSTDRSLDLCQDFAAGDQRIRVISQEKRGISAARNRGLDAAAGEYFFFLDSDDVIHPLLLEEMLLQARNNNADLLACGQAKLEPSQFEFAVGNMSVQDQRPDWETALQESFYDYRSILSGAGGKMIRMSCTCGLRFREDLFSGEDTYYISQLFNRQIQVTYTSQKWYYYRRHSESLTRSQSLITDPHYYDAYHLLIEDALVASHEYDAQGWESDLLARFKDNYLNLSRSNNTAGMAAIKNLAVAEFKSPIFCSLPRIVRWYFRIFFFNYLLYNLCSAPGRIYRTACTALRRFLTRLVIHEIGILTFHCSDNFGAMLQAYGLQTYLRGTRDVDVAVIPYAPPYMTGRHWYIPYVPYTGADGFVCCLRNALAGWRRHKSMGLDFFRQRANMRRFRRRYLVRNHLPILFTWQLYFVPCRCYVVGSDQIWNPDITMGLRQAYFGAFPGLRKKRVVAYAASLGSKALPDRYDQQFADLLSHVDAVSVREVDAIPYLQKFRSEPVKEVLDPVFLIGWEAWQCVEHLPERKSFILLYVTENDLVLYDYARRLSQEKGLPIVQLKSTKWVEKEEFDVDYTAGPAEFLGYIHQADYVVTNSFHAVAFSIIYQKQFMTFLHSTLGARVRNVLRVHNLENRIYQEGAEIDSPIDWDAVLVRFRENVRLSQEFIDTQIY